ncbi:SGNH/GDSL hydrolase family protein [Lewinella sp. IMCC34183]|uniref:SGNH/GDSL hydrolase family protein n=1 Tax=Lewinella sp. IMCC34183 TaxID=2248762 RepID=UPI00130066A6|nr:SGNH/GDSL hydrolase family protein [Lewinella sp. IMCC34183]
MNKTITLYLLAGLVALGLLPGSLAAQEAMDTIQIDFGEPATTGLWNSLTDTQEGAINSLINKREVMSNYRIEVTDPFGGRNGNGTTEASASIDLPASASGDSFFGSQTTFNQRREPTGAVTISNLDPELDYTFTIFASRMIEPQDNRQTVYTATGATEETTDLDVANNVSQTATVTLRPATDGTIVLSATTGPNNTTPQGFYYLGAVIISYPLVETPPPPIVVDDPSCTIVVLGSSTAEGVGPTNRDSAWVNRYAASLASDTSIRIVNLALGGYTTYEILPDGASRPSDVNIEVDENRNITEALSYDPIAIIVNMPSNDAAKNISVAEQLANYRTIADSAAAYGVPIYIATTQPRNFSDATKIPIQIEVRDSILKIYGDRAIDFWTGIAAENGFIREELGSGDGTHLNAAGHRILFERVAALQIDTLCGSDTSSTAVRLPITELTGVSVYPNPSANGLLYVELAPELSGDVLLRVTDLMGRERLRREYNLDGASHRLEIFTNTLVRGGGAEYLLCTVMVRQGDEWRRKTIPVLVR